MIAVADRVFSKKRALADHLARTAINPATPGSFDELGCAKLARIPYPKIEKLGRF